jgi:hypothetical protein
MLKLEKIFPFDRIGHLADTGYVSVHVIADMSTLLGGQHDQLSTGKNDQI